MVHKFIVVCCVYSYIISYIYIYLYNYYECIRTPAPRSQVFNTDGSVFLMNFEGWMLLFVVRVTI